MFYSDLIMTDLNTKAENYAAEKTNDLIAKAIAQAYADGYRDGYKDCEAERPVILNDSSNEYVDLGLPSGTLWASDYEREKGSTIYTSYEKAFKLSIPTKEQVQELLDFCLWEKIKGQRGSSCNICFGPNGKSIEFDVTGYKIPEPVNSIEGYYWNTWFWIKDHREGIEKPAINIIGLGQGKRGEFKTLTPGLLLPLRLVKTK